MNDKNDLNLDNIIRYEVTQKIAQLDPTRTYGMLDMVSPDFHEALGTLSKYAGRRLARMVAQSQLPLMRDGYTTSRHNAYRLIVQ